MNSLDDRQETQTITPEALAALGTKELVYVRPVNLAELDGELENIDQIPEDATLYAVHAADGTRMAVLTDRETAFAAARHYEMEPLSVH